MSAESEGGMAAYRGSAPRQAMGAGAMQGVSYVRRVATQGGVAPTMACDAAGVGQKQVVKYRADSIFYKAM